MTDWLKRPFARSSSGSKPTHTAERAASTEARRSVRVFISSTFLDMQRERDVLVRETFPSLRTRFRLRGVELREVDLRWGITQEESESGEMLPICLSEIDRCRPYFIGLLGERYGSAVGQSTITDQLREAVPALAAASGKSVSEVEIIYGALAASEPTNAFFFERDPAWVTSVRADAKRPVAETRQSARKQARLKKRIRKSGYPVTTYATPDDIGAAVEAVLGAALDAQFPEQDLGDPFAQQSRLHEAYARERIGLHIGATTYLQALDEWLVKDGVGPMLIEGVSGVGKSTLVANWVHRQRHSGAQLILIDHYLGAEPESSEPILLMRRLWECLNRETHQFLEPPSGDSDLMGIAAALADRFASANEYAEQNNLRIIIALDGLDKLAVEKNLRWLPDARYSRISLLLSAVHGAMTEIAHVRGWKTLTVRSLSEAERRDFVSQTLNIWGKALAPERARRILEHELAGVPLFLRTILDELRYSSTESRLDRQLSAYLEANDIAGLFGRVLERVELDCGREFTARALAPIWASRAGLEEAELLAVTGASPLVWSRARIALGDTLRDQIGRITFSHDYLRRAVVERYLSSEDARREAHLALADHFTNVDIDARQTEELPYQLRAAEAWDRLEALLVEIDRFGRQTARGYPEFLSYWRPLMDAGRDAGSLLVEAFERRMGDVGSWPQEALDYANAILAFLEFAGLHGDAMQRLAKNTAVVARGTLGGDDEHALRAMGRLAESMRMNGDFATAKAIYEEQAKKCTQELGVTHAETLTSRNNLASVLHDMGDIRGAHAIYREVYEARRSSVGLGDEETLATMNNLAATLNAMGHVDEAFAMQEEVIEAAEHFLGPDDSMTMTLKIKLTDYLNRRGELERAVDLGEHTLQDLVRELGSEHPETLAAYVTVGNTLEACGDHAGAKAHFATALGGCKRVFGLEHTKTADAVGKLASAHIGLREYGTAAQLFRQSFEINKKNRGADHPETLLHMANLGVALFSGGERVEAENLFIELVERTESVFGRDHPDTQAALEDLARVRAPLGDT